jgi:hypothetical protein
MEGKRRCPSSSRRNPGRPPLPVPAPARIPVPLRLRRCGEVGRLAARSLVAAPVLAASVVGATSRGCFDWSGRSGSPAVAADPRRRAWPSHTGRPTGVADHLHPGGSALVRAVLTDRWFGRGGNRETALAYVSGQVIRIGAGTAATPGVAGRLVGVPDYHVHFWRELPLHVAMRIDASLSDDAAARHSAVFAIGRIVPSERNCQVCAPVLLHL